MYILRITQYGDPAITIGVFSADTTKAQVLKFLGNLYDAVKNINSLQELERLNPRQEQDLQAYRKFIGEKTGESEIDETTRFSFAEVRTVQP